LLKRSEFKFDLPKELIAFKPSDNRAESRLLVFEANKSSLTDAKFAELLDYFKEGDCLVRNNTKVMKARLFGNKETGGKLECLVERVLDKQNLLAHLKASKAPTLDSLISLSGVIFRVMGREHGLYHLALESKGDVFDVLDAHGELPLPPYIERAPEAEDEKRYQTVYAKELGAVAAPTAGLHFDEAMFSALKEKGVEVLEVTLHVGAGTFKPVMVETISDHHMHQEWLSVSQEVVDKINATKARGSRVFAVGTTVVRSLESAARNGTLAAFEGLSDIFITPGFKFKVVDGLITNFHLPESTLIMLVSAFIGHAETMALYQHAIDESYRFFSYGDATLLLSESCG
jgi:S-adenosylmethionine:tRNA ribosyltransferase-isomerase